MVIVTQADRDMVKKCNQLIAGYGEILPEHHAHLFAAHRIAAIEECAKVAEDQQKVFASNEYSIGQPMSSFGERFACRRVAEEIRELKGGNDD